MTDAEKDMERLPEVKARADAATEGPWNVGIDDTGGPFTLWPSVSGPEDADETIIHRAGFRQEFWEANSLRRCKANATFIAHAREDVPYLLDTITTLRAERDAAIARAEKLEAALKPFAEHDDFHASDDWAVTQIDDGSPDLIPGVTAGDFKRAKAAIASLTEGE